MATTVLDYKGIMVLIWTLWGTALATTIFRIASQVKLQRRLFADDHFVIGGMVTLTALSAVITRLLPQFYLAGEYTKAAMLDPLTPLPLPQDEFMARTSTSLKLMFSQMLLFWTTLWAAKFSILFFVKRLVQGLPVYVRAWWACFAAVMVLYLGCMLSNFLTCTPLDKYWSATGCSDPEDLVRADVSIKFATTADVVADLIIMVLPLKLIWKLKTNAKNKAGLGLLFSLGCIIIAFALVRMAQVTKATSQTAQDPTTVANGPVLLSMWSHIESSVSVIVATLPAFRFLLRANRDRLMSRQTPGYNNGYNSKGSSKWKKQSVRLGGADSHHTGESGSQTELRSVAGIHKKVEYRVEEFSEDADLDDNARRTRQIFQ